MAEQDPMLGSLAPLLEVIRAELLPMLLKQEEERKQWLEEYQKRRKEAAARSLTLPDDEVMVEMDA